MRFFNSFKDKLTNHKAFVRISWYLFCWLRTPELSVLCYYDNHQLPEFFSMVISRFSAFLFCCLIGLIRAHVAGLTIIILSKNIHDLMSHRQSISPFVLLHVLLMLNNIRQQHISLWLIKLEQTLNLESHLTPLPLSFWIELLIYQVCRCANEYK